MAGSRLLRAKRLLRLQSPALLLPALIASNQLVTYSMRSCGSI